MTASVLIIDPAFPFAELAHRLATLDFARDTHTWPATPDTLPGEPELAAWQHGDAPPPGTDARRDGRSD